MITVYLTCFLKLLPAPDLPQVTRRSARLTAAVVRPQYTEEFVSGLQTELEQSRLREAELLGALKEMQDKVLDLEKVNE